MKRKYGWLRRIFWSILILIVLFTGIIFLYIKYDQYTPNQQRHPIVIKGGYIFNGTNILTKNNLLVIENGKIKCLGDDCIEPNDAIIIDAKDKAILPGLIDMHVHFTAPSEESSDYSIPMMVLDNIRNRPEVRKNFQAYGVTSIRSAGGSLDELELRQLLLNDRLEGPRMFVAGPAFTAPKGHPAGTVFKNNKMLAKKFSFQLDDAELAREEVQKLAQQKVDGIKVIYDNGTVKKPIPRLKKEVMQAVIDEALKQNIWVAVHTGSLEELSDAIEAGASTIEHGIKELQEIDSLTLLLMREREITYVPTLVVAKNFIGETDPELMEMHKKNTRLVSKTGISIAAGSDTQGKDMKFGKTLHDELKLLVESGLTPVDALNAATRTPAKALKRENELGRVALNYWGDLIIVNGTPWNDINDIDNIDIVIQNGRIVFKK